MMTPRTFSMSQTTRKKPVGITICFSIPTQHSPSVSFSLGSSSDSFVFRDCPRRRLCLSISLSLSPRSSCCSFCLWTSPEISSSSHSSCSSKRELAMGTGLPLQRVFLSSILLQTQAPFLLLFSAQKQCAGHFFQVNVDPRVSLEPRIKVMAQPFAEFNVPPNFIQDMNSFIFKHWKNGR